MKLNFVCLAMEFSIKNINYKEFLIYSKFLPTIANTFHYQLRKLHYSSQDGGHSQIKLSIVSLNLLKIAKLYNNFP